MKQWECSVCGYVHQGEEPPLQCPVCKADKDKFIEITASEEGSGEIKKEKNGGESSTVDHSQSAPAMMDTITDLLVDNHLHPISVHSPNGIIPVAVLFLILVVLFQFSSFESAAYYNMIAVLLSMPVVIVSGIVTWQKKYTGALTSVFKIKIAASCVATITLFVLVVWRAVQPDVLSSGSSGRWIFLLGSLLLLGTVGLAGHLGGQLVFAKKN